MQTDNLTLTDKTNVEKLETVGWQLSLKEKTSFIYSIKEPWDGLIHVVLCRICTPTFAHAAHKMPWS